jgi:hypothetical protein
MNAALGAALISLLASASAFAADLRLLMVEQPGCIYCASWHEEVGPEYPVTEEGRAAPLLQIMLRDPLPEGITLTRPAAFTPTFILLRDGQEQGRLEGYPSEDFFWPLLRKMIQEAQSQGE